MVIYANLVALNLINFYYNVYNGSLTDRTNLSYVLANAAELGIKNIKMICDGGFWSEECLTSLVETSRNFIVGMPFSLTLSKQICNKYGKDITLYQNKLNILSNTYCKPIETKIYGILGKIHLYFSNESHGIQWTEMDNTITRLKTELSNLKVFPVKKLNKYSKYFIITKNDKDNGFSYKLNYDTINQIREKKGFFLIFTNDINQESDKILEYYRAKDADEKLFQQIKDYMSCLRIRTHNEKTTQGKIFIAFLACIIRSYIQNKIKTFLNSESLSLDKVFARLSNICIASNSLNEFRLTKALTKDQKNILDNFGGFEKLIESLKSIK